MHLIGFHLDRQAVQLVVGDRTVKLHRVLQLLHRHTQALEEQPPGLPGDAYRLEAAGLQAGAGQAQLNALRHQLLDAGADQAAQVLAVAEHFHRLRRRGVLVHFAENGFQRFQHRLFAAEMQGAHFVPRVAIQQIDAAHQALLLLAEAEHVQLAEIEVHHLIAEGGGRIVFQIDDDRQMANFARAVQRFRRRQAAGNDEKRRPPVPAAWRCRTGCRS